MYGLPDPPSFKVVGEMVGGTRPLYPAITGASESGTTVTITTASATGLSVSDVVNIGNFRPLVTTACTSLRAWAPIPSHTRPPRDWEAQQPSERSIIRSTPGETALDVEWAHAMAPGANIVLIEMSGGLCRELGCHQCGHHRAGDRRDTSFR